MDFLVEIPILIVFYYIAKKLLKALNKNKGNKSTLEKYIYKAKEVFGESIEDYIGEFKDDFIDETKILSKETEKVDLPKEEINIDVRKKAAEEKRKSDYTRKIKRRGDNRIKRDKITNMERSHSLLKLSSKELQRGIILKEVLDAPRAKNPYYPIYKK